MNHKDFCTLSGLVTMGNINIVDDMPTAGTNGVDVFYGKEFSLKQTRKQLRFVQCHEALHKGLRHCSDYKDIVKKYPQLSNIAMDYVVNAFIEQTDPKHEFIEHTTDPKPLLDPKYYNRSFVDVLQDLLKNGMGKGGGGGLGEGGGEVGGKGVVSEMSGSAAAEIIAGPILGLMVSPIITFILALMGNDISLGSGAILSSALGLVLGIISAAAVDSPGGARDKYAQELQSVENEKKYFAHLDINGAKTAQEKDDYNRLYKKYGEYMVKRPDEMSNVDREKYAAEYLANKSANYSAPKDWQDTEKISKWRETNRGVKTAEAPPVVAPTTSPKRQRMRRS
jgi:hypothetical protein